jgi:hypothetical protein
MSAGFKSRFEAHAPTHHDRGPKLASQASGGEGRTSVFDNYIIEIDDEAAGILIRSGRSFAFHALEGTFATLEGHIFPDVVAAERAARKIRRNPTAASLAKAS